MYRAQACYLRCRKIFLACAKGTEVATGPYSIDEIEEAQNSLYRLAQIECYRDEVISMQKSDTVELPESSCLYKLSSGLVDKDLIRLYGRIDKADGVSEYVKQPIILSKAHAVTALIVYDYHIQYHHLNHETVINELRQKYYIPRLRKLVKSVRFKCQRCKNARASPRCPEMAELPSSRLAAYVRPFTYVGVDCFGPITVAIGRRTEKRWGPCFELPKE